MQAMTPEGPPPSPNLVKTTLYVIIKEGGGGLSSPRLYIIPQKGGPRQFLLLNPSWLAHPEMNMTYEMGDSIRIKWPIYR